MKFTLWKRDLWFGFFFMLALLSCAPEISLEISPEKKCLADNDCVPAQCCHAADAVGKEYAPDCSGIFCTMACQPGTLDCQQGDVKCVEGECQAVIR